MTATIYEAIGRLVVRFVRVKTIGRLVVRFVRVRYRRPIRMAAALGIVAAAATAYVATTREPPEG